MEVKLHLSSPWHYMEGSGQFYAPGRFIHRWYLLDRLDAMEKRKILPRARIEPRPSSPQSVATSTGLSLLSSLQNIFTVCCIKSYFVRKLSKSDKTLVDQVQSKSVFSFGAQVSSQEYIPTPWTICGFAERNRVPVDAASRIALNVSIDGRTRSGQWYVTWFILFSCSRPASSICIVRRRHCHNYCVFKRNGPTSTRKQLL